MKLYELKDKYLEYVKCFKSDGTFRFYYHHLNNIIDYFGDIYPDEINRDMILNYINSLKYKELNSKTINYRILSLKTMFKYFEFNDHVIFSFPKLKTKEFRYQNLSRKEIKMLVEYILYSKIKTNSKLILSLLLETGIRLNELIHIKNENINLEKKMIYLDYTKTGIDRIVFYSELSDKYIRDIISEDKYLIKTRPRGIYAIFQRANKVLKFKNFHPHMLRHTYATILVENNTNLEFVRMTLGHKSLKTTQRYLHFNHDVMRNIYDHNFKY